MNFKVLKVATVAMIVILVSFQVFWRMRYGSGEIYIQNQDLNSTYMTHVLLNGEGVGEYNFNPNNIIPHKLNLGKGMGSKKIMIIRQDNQYSVETKINTFLVKWVIVSINDDKDIKVKSSILPPLLQ